MKNKGNKIILITGIILLLIIVCVVYYFFYGSLNNKSIKYNNPKKLVEGYVESLINQDYKESIKYIYLPDNSFVNKSDFEKYVKTKYYYNDISNMKIDSISDDEDSTFDLVLSDKDGNTIKMTINVVERTVHDFRIVEEIYIEDYFFSVPTNTTVYIDDYEVSKELIAKKSSNYDYYLLPAIANNEKEFKLVNKLSTYTVKITPVEENEAYKISFKLNDEELKNKAYDYIKTTWNDMYNSYFDKKKVSTVMHYFDEKFTESDVKKHYSDGFKHISTGLTSIGRFQNYSIKKIVDNPNEASLILSDELIKVNFGYTLKWKWKYIGADSAVKMSMNRYSSIILKVKDDSFVIYDVTDSGLFNYTSQYTRDF